MIGKRIATWVGLGGERSAPPPRYVAVADGLIVTESASEAWYVLSSENSDLMSEGHRDAIHDQATAALSKTLAGLDCHLRILWSPMAPEDYRAEAAELFTAGNHQLWTEMRVARLAQLDLPSRQLLLGVKLVERGNPAKARGSSAVTDALGLGQRAVPSRELAQLHALSSRLGRRLERSPWTAQPASVEMLAWMIAREQHRASPLPVPGPEGVIEGAQLVSLTRGRVLPYPDHLRFVDASGQTTAWSAVLTMPMFPPVMETPGAGEWLRVLSEITYVPPEGGEDEDEIPVDVEASVRWQVLHKRDALKLVEANRRLAKEQRQSASQHSAGETSQETEETESTMAALARDMRREDITLVHDHPRLVVTSESSLEDLRARVDAVVGFYANEGITVEVGADEQRDLWLETQPCDMVRVPDLGHIRTAQALAGSWWWGGSSVGDDTGPIVGYLTGSTPGVVRFDATTGAERGDATTSLWVGRSGRGKSTGVALSCLDAGCRGSFVQLLDFKGDMGGLVDAAEVLGLPARLAQTGARFAGVADLFGLLTGDSSEQATIEVAAQLTMALPEHLRIRGAETPIQAAVNAVARGTEPATWKVIEHLAANEADEFSRELGDALFELAQTALGAPFMGKPTGESLLTPTPGIWVVQMPGLSLPDLQRPRESWTVAQRLSEALMHSMLAYCISVTGRRDLRGLRKCVAVPEVHVLTATAQGAAFLSYVARVGRALNCDLLLDTQDPESILGLTALVEQITSIFGFQLTSPEQQDALARLLRLPVGEHTRALIHQIGLDDDGEIRHGHCIYRDRREQAALMQWDIPDGRIADLLSTTPDVGTTVPAPTDQQPADAPAPLS